jgi:hypothetical protein
MKADLQPICAALVKRYLHTQYDGISGMQVKAGVIATDDGVRALQDSIAAARQENLRRRRTLLEVNFELIQVQVPPVADTRLQVTAVERFNLQYDSPFAEEKQVHGRRGHTFTLTVGPDGEWLIDGCQTKVLEEKRGAGPAVVHEAPSAPPPTRQMARPDTPVATGPSERELARDRELARLRLRQGLRKLVTVGLLLGAVGVVYLWFFGAHTNQVQVCLYTGRERQKLAVMGHVLIDRDRPTSLSQWAEKWVDPPAQTPDHHYWVDKSGWVKEFGESRVYRSRSESTTEALDTLHRVRRYGDTSEREAINYLVRYHGVIHQLVALLEKQPGARPWEEIRQELGKINHELRNK